MRAVLRIKRSGSKNRSSKCAQALLMLLAGGNGQKIQAFRMSGQDHGVHAWWAGLGQNIGDMRNASSHGC